MTGGIILRYSKVKTFEIVKQIHQFQTIEWWSSMISRLYPNPTCLPMLQCWWDVASVWIFLIFNLLFWTGLLVFPLFVAIPCFVFSSCCFCGSLVPVIITYWNLPYKERRINLNRHARIRQIYMKRFQRPTHHSISCGSRCFWSTTRFAFDLWCRVSFPGTISMTHGFPATRWGTISISWWEYWKKQLVPLLDFSVAILNDQSLRTTCLHWLF